MLVTDRAAWDAQTDWTTGRWRPRPAARVRAIWQPAPQPGELPKRPLRLAEILDSGFRLLRYSPGVSVGAAMITLTLLLLAFGALVAGIGWLTFGYLFSISDSPDAAGGLTFLMQLGASIIAFLSLCFLHFLSGMLAAPTYHAFFSRVGAQPRDSRGRKTTTLRATWQQLAGRRRRLIGATALLGTAHLVALLVLVMPGVLIALFAGLAVVGSVLAVIGVLLWFVFTVFFMVRTAFVGCAITAEGLTIRQAFARSWELTGRRFWATAGTLLLTYVLSSQLISIIISPVMIVFFIVVLVVALTIGSGDEYEQFAYIAFAVLTILGVSLTSAATAVFYAYMSGVITGLYFDRRMRFDGYDLVLLREAEERGAAEAGAASGAQPAPEAGAADGDRSAAA